MALFWRARLNHEAKRQSAELNTACPYCGGAVLIRYVDHGDGVPAYNVDCFRCDYTAGHFDNLDDAVQSLTNGKLSEYI